MLPNVLTMDDLKPDQLAVVETVCQFVDDPYALDLLIEGPAGTGKTSSIRATIGQLPEDVAAGTVVCAPTNKAVKVAREMSGGMLETMTIYRFLGLSLQANGEVKELRQHDGTLERMMQTKLVVMDEASMAGEALRPFIRQAQEDFGIKFVAVCDRFQLPPVGETQSWVFDEFTRRIALTEVKRHDNAILNLATHIREVIELGGPLVIADNFHDETGGVVTYARFKAFDEAILDRWTATQAEEGEYSSHRVLAWRNMRVNGYNEHVREAIYGRKEARDSPLMVGERVVVCNPVKSLQEDDTFLMYTDEEAIIKTISVTKHPKYPEIEVFKMVVIRESNGEPCGLYAPTPNGKRVADRMLNQFKNRAIRDDRVFWGAFWALKELMNDVRPCHALTTHRSQGSTFREVFVDADDIMANPSRDEALRSLYVAVTRASFKVSIKWSGR